MESELPITVDALNQMIMLYKRFDKKKIANILVMMETKNIKPSLLTYKLLIDVKGQSNDILRMEQLIEKMKTDAVEPDIHLLALIAKHYLSMGSIGKAETFIKEMEERKWEDISDARRTLLLFYASLGKVDGVYKIWKDCESDLKMKDCIAAIEAWGKLGKVEEAESVFELMHHKWKNLRSKHYSLLLNIFIKNKLVTKGKDLVKRMSDNGLHVGHLTWDSVVRLYIEAGDVEKADSILQKLAQTKQMKPSFKICTAVMDMYARRGDIHNTEKLFHRLRELGYTGHILPFKILNQAYINAKTPAYGLLERMKADNVYPDEVILRRLTLQDPFRKTAASELLD
uniref:Uncharacterized protein MANES_04G156100 n=1 Tax=Rhizophora mucronata TaxID=61149 RepID=A0A2P2PIB0_RHIMU